jgi:hypothetical protein
MNERLEAEQRVQEPFKELEVRYEQAKQELEGIPGTDVEAQAESEERLSQIAAQINERTNGLFDYAEGLEQLFGEGHDISQDLDHADRGASAISDTKARLFIRKKIAGLRKKLKEQFEEERDKERPFRKTSFSDLKNQLQQTEQVLRDGNPGEADYEEAKDKLPILRREMDERTDGAYSQAQYLRRRLDKGSRVTDDEMGALRRKASNLASKDEKAADYVHELVRSLEKVRAEKEEAALELSDEDKRLPEPEEVHKRGKRMAKAKEELPKVYLSMLTTTLADVKLPTRMYERQIATEEGGWVQARVHPVRNVREAVKAGLKLLSDNIKEKSSPFTSFEKAHIKYYIGLVNEWVGEDEDPELSQIYTDFSRLAEDAFKLFDFFYGRGGWNENIRTKAKGNEKILTASGSLGTRLAHRFLQDPKVESAWHRIEGQVGEDVFMVGDANRDIEGGKMGAAEKIGWFVSHLMYQRAWDEPSIVSKSNYNAYVVFHQVPYYDKGYYPGFKALLAAQCLYRVPGQEIEFEPDPFLSRPKVRLLEPGKKKVLRYRFNLMGPPTVLNSPDNIDCVMEKENFSEETLGWKNVGRMLVTYGDYDPRYSDYEASSDEERIRHGYYTLTEWFFADESQKRRMYRKALARFRKLDPEDKRAIISVNLITTYDYADVVEDSQGRKKLEWYTKPLLDFNETDKDGNYIVDVGSLKGKWCGGLDGNTFGIYFTLMDYVFRTFSQMDELYKLDPKAQQDRMEKLLELLSPTVGFRHLSEKMRLDPALARTYVVIRQRLLEHVFDRFAKVWLEYVWGNRSEGKREVGGIRGWEKMANRLIYYGMEARHFRQEFEDIGEYLTSYPNLTERLREYTFSARVAKILGRFELKDAWAAYLRDLVGLDKKAAEVLFGPQFSLNVNTHRNRLMAWAHEKGVWDDLVKQDKEDRRWTFYPDNIRILPRRGLIKGGWDIFTMAAKGVIGRPEKPPEPVTISLAEANAEQRARIVLDEIAYRTIVYYAGFDIDKEFLEYDWYGMPVWRTWFKLDFDPRKGEKRGDGPARKRFFENDEDWQEIKSFLEVERATGEGKTYLGALDHPFYSPFSKMYEKSDEEKVRRGIVEYWMRQTFDKDIRDYVWPHRWRGMAKKHKERWDRYCWYVRRGRYTVGKLRGLYPIAQPIVEFEGDLPLFEDAETDKIIKPRRLADGRYEIFVETRDPRTGQRTGRTERVVVDVDEVTKLPRNTADPRWRVRLKHVKVGDFGLEQPEIAWRAAGVSLGTKRQMPLIGRDEMATMVLGTEGSWSTRERNRGMGRAGLKEQLTFEPLCYFPQELIALLLNRYFDARYVDERGLNTGKETEAHKLYLFVGDENARILFYKRIYELGEDEDLAMGEARRDGVDPGVANVKFIEAQEALMIPRVDVKTQAWEKREQFINLENLLVTFLPPETPESFKKHLLPFLTFKSSNERNMAIRAALIGEIPFVLASLAGVFPGSTVVSGALLLGAFQAIPIAFVNMVKDKGFDEKGNEQVSGLSRAFQSSLGLDVITGKDVNFGLGPFGLRKKVRRLAYLAWGFEPVWVSALTQEVIDALVKYWITDRKQEMARVGGVSV